MMKNLRNFRELFFIFVLKFFFVWSAKEEKAEVLEFCERQSFSADCGEDRMVVMSTARYGRMRVGRCLAPSLVDPNCDVDVLPQFDSWCSGRRSCHVRVSSIFDALADTDLSCLRDFRAYLEASYVCVRVLSRPKTDCSLAQPIKTNLVESTGYIGSIVTEETGCGSLDTPWVLTVARGQSITLELYDFGLVNSRKAKQNSEERHGSVSKICHVYAVIKERLMGAGETICGGEDRQSVVFTSKNNVVEVRLVATVTPSVNPHAASSSSSSSSAKKLPQQTSYFAFKYIVTGCENLTPSTGQWVEHNGNAAYVGCNGTSSRSHLICEGGKWVGELPDCTPVFWGVSDRSIMPGDFWKMFTNSRWLTIFSILGIALLIGLIIFLLGVLFLKKKKVPSATLR